MTAKLSAAAAGVRALAALPAPLQLLLAGGRPVRVDGQLLEPEVQLLLRAFGLFDSHATRSVEEARRSTRANAGLVGPRCPLPMAAGEELDKGRLYVPPGVGTPSPLLVYFPGGGFVCGDLDTHDSA